jgi:4-hydroxybenzoate polyprenyltransferase
MAGVLCAVVAINWLYNNVAGGLKQRPPWELLAQVGYLLVVPVSCWLNAVPLPGWPAWLYLSMFAVQSHLIGEVMDIEPDRRSGRRTTATSIGIRRTKLLILALVLAECVVVGVWMDALPLTLLLVGACLWLILDLTWLFRDRQTYTLREMRLAGFGSNALALFSAAYVWHSGCLAGL